MHLSASSCASLVCWLPPGHLTPARFPAALLSRPSRCSVREGPEKSIRTLASLSVESCQDETTAAAETAGGLRRCDRDTKAFAIHAKYSAHWATFSSTASGPPFVFFSFRPRRGFPPTLISVPTAPDRTLGPGSTAVNTSFIKVLALNQLSGTLPPPGTLTDADYSGRKRMVART